ncbi:MAG: extracellular solute-binding protein [Spirochaetaceae bacterium]|jgi:ABC-type glycerol-3-phosphate transport system substrate-binding protein|nr:extracellular solute-binding protein [Spirochaetaceae bacterium]
MKTLRKNSLFALCCAVLMAAAALFTLGGCNRKSGEAAASGEKGPVNITFRTWNPGPGEGWDIVMAEWAKIHPEITVEMLQVAYSDHVQSLKVVVASGEGPDLYGIQTGAIMQEFSEFTVDVAPKMAAKYGANWENKFIPVFLELTKGGMDTYYGLPTGAGSAGYLWANLSYFDKYGLKVPSNYNELLAVTKEFRARGEMPLITGAKDDWINLDTFINIGADINAEKLYAAIEGQVSFTDPEIVQALTIWKSLFDNGIFQDGALGINIYNDATTIWETDKLAPMITNGSWVTNGIDTFGVGEHFDVFTIDWNNDGKQAHVAPSVDVVVSISKESKHPDEAWTFFDWYCTEGVKNLIDYNLSYFPVLSDHVVDLSRFSAEAQKNINKIIGIVQDRAYGYRDMPYPRLKQTIADQLKAVALGESTPQRAAEIIETASKAERR